MDVFIILQLPCKLFSGKNKGRKTTTLQETPADQIIQHY